jgi:plasmid maintenance system killer protein
MNLKLLIFLFIAIYTNTKGIAQLSMLKFSLNNFIHQKSSFTPTNNIDTRGAFIEPSHSFGQHYFLERELLIKPKLALSFGIGIGNTRFKFSFKSSAEFNSGIFENKFIETRSGNTNTMLIAPIGILYNLLENENKALFINVNLKTIYSLRTLVSFMSASDGTPIQKIETIVNNENKLDFTVGAAIDYRTRIAKSKFWWSIKLNANYALTDYLEGQGMLFGDAENLTFDVEIRLNHIGLELGLIKSFD